MKIIFAGTSHGIPEKDRFCSSCFLLVGERCYVIDAGAPISQLLLRYGIRHADVKGIFVTHLHGDHFNGLPEFCEQVSWYYTAADPDIFLPDERGVRLLENWVEEIAPVGRRRALKYHTYTPGCIFDDGSVRVTAMATRHNLEKSHAFKIEAKGRKLLFTGDMSHNFTEFQALHSNEDYDLIVCESAHCFDFRDVADVVSTARTKNFVINHFNPAKQEGVQAFQNIAPWNCTVAYDGYVMDM